MTLALEVSLYDWPPAWLVWIGPNNYLSQSIDRNVKKLKQFVIRFLLYLWSCNRIPEAFVFWSFLAFRVSSWSEVLFPLFHSSDVHFTFSKFCNNGKFTYFRSVPYLSDSNKKSNVKIYFAQFGVEQFANRLRIRNNLTMILLPYLLRHKCKQGSKHSFFLSLSLSHSFLIHTFVIFLFLPLLFHPPPYP